LSRSPVSDERPADHACGIRSGAIFGHVPCEKSPRPTARHFSCVPSARDVTWARVLERYVISLLASDLPFDAWVAVVVWLALFFANHHIAQLTRAANDSQRAMTVEDWDAVRSGLQPRNIVAKIVFAGVVFTLSYLAGGPAFVFFAGGLIVSTIYAIALNVQGLLSARAMSGPAGVSGSLNFPTVSALRHMSQRAAGGALACLLMGLILAHLALLGGALSLASTANRYFLRAKKIHPQG
jgi:hypothetical protein